MAGDRRKKDSLLHADGVSGRILQADSAKAAGRCDLEIGRCIPFGLQGKYRKERQDWKDFRLTKLISML